MKISEVDWHGRGNRRLDLPGDVELRLARGTAGIERRDPNPRAVAGGNNPPATTTLEFATTAMDLMKAFLNDNPVIETGAQAEAAKIQIETARGCLAGMETERDAKVRPLNEKVADINGIYKAVSAPFKKVLDQVRERLTAYANAVEQERQRIADIKRRVAEAMIAKAIEAERLEQEAIENARQGEIDAGVAEKIVEADAAFAAASKANRQATVAEREADTVRIGGGHGRSLGMRTTTTLTLDDPIAAIKAMGGISEKTREAILSDARAWRKLNDQKWPAGVTAVETRGI
jgi:hypothetical protein